LIILPFFLCCCFLVIVGLQADDNKKTDLSFISWEVEQIRVCCYMLSPLQQ